MERFNSIPYAIIARISRGWSLLETSRDLADAYRLYESHKYSEKKLLNYGRVLREKDILKEVALQNSAAAISIITKADLMRMLPN